MLPTLQPVINVIETILMLHTCQSGLDMNECSEQYKKESCIYNASNNRIVLHI